VSTLGLDETVMLHAGRRTRTTDMMVFGDLDRSRLLHMALGTALSRVERWLTERD
jgi:hypothetical protein